MSRMTSTRGLLTAAALAAAMVGGAGAAFAQQSAGLVRLTPEQYERSIHDIFGADISIDANKVDPGFRDDGLLALGNRRLTLSAAALERDDTLAQQIAAQVADPHRRATLVGCNRARTRRRTMPARARFVERVGLPSVPPAALRAEEIKRYVATAARAAESAA